jgi:hypothetical protein
MAAFEKRRHEKTGRPFYRIKVRFKGAPPQSKSFERPTDARNWAAAELGTKQPKVFPIPGY